MTTLPKVPRLWSTRDPRKLVSMGQLALPGLGIENSKTSEQAWAELESAGSQNRRSSTTPKEDTNAC